MYKIEKNIPFPSGLGGDCNPHAKINYPIADMKVKDSFLIKVSESEKNLNYDVFSRIRQKLSRQAEKQRRKIPSFRITTRVTEKKNGIRVWRIS
jgi:hypothetical protein